jgi:hypothetical protein
MRMPYESPEIALLGSVMDLTQANMTGETSDNLLVLRGPGPEDDMYS